MITLHSCKYLSLHKALTVCCVFQFQYVPDTSQDCGIPSSQPSSLIPLTFNGVHKTLEMKQSNDGSGQSVFITNATYIMNKGKQQTFLKSWPLFPQKSFFVKKG